MKGPARPESTFRATEDEALVRELRDGAPGALRRLFDAHAPRLWRLLYRVTGDYDDAHDLTQEAILHALRKIHRYDGRGSFAGWIARLGLNVARDELRKRRRRAERLTRAPPAAPMPSPGDPLIAARVQAAMDALTEDERMVVVMHELEGYTHEEIGAALGIAAGSARSRLSRARARLRERLGTLNEQEEP